MRKMVTLAAAATTLAGCSLTVPVQGAFNDGSGTFSGTATGYMDGSGTLQITTQDGVTCKGQFVYVTPRIGEGTFTCSDGRSGPFRSFAAGSHGTGAGTLGGKPFSFTFG